MRMLTTGIVLAASSLTVAQAAQAESYHRADRLAGHLSRQAEDLVRKVRLHFQHSAVFPAMKGDAQRLMEDAFRIRRMIDSPTPIKLVRRDLDEFDQRLERFEENVKDLRKDWEDFEERDKKFRRSGRFRTGYVYSGSFQDRHAYGPANRFHLRRMKSHTDRMQETVDRLDDVLEDWQERLEDRRRFRRGGRFEPIDRHRGGGFSIHWQSI